MHMITHALDNNINALDKNYFDGFEVLKVLKF